jgi:hypothetical protein
MITLLESAPATPHSWIARFLPDWNWGSRKKQILKMFLKKTFVGGGGFFFVSHFFLWFCAGWYTLHCLRNREYYFSTRIYIGGWEGFFFWPINKKDETTMVLIHLITVKNIWFFFSFFFSRNQHFMEQESFPKSLWCKLTVDNNTIRK